MSRILLIFIYLCILPVARLDARELKTKTCFLQEDSVTVCRLLDEARHLPRTSNYTLFFAKKFLEVPYVAHTLEINDEEQLVVNTRQLDCTTLVETVTSLTLCAYHHLFTWRDFLNALTSMRYRDGRIENYTSRIHYFTEWIDANSMAGIVTEIQSPDPPFSAVQKVNVDYMSCHPENYKALRLHPEYIDEIRLMEKRLAGRKYRYIPKRSVGYFSRLRNVIKDGDIIAICCNKKGLDIAHLGLAIWENGELHLLNASMLHKKVVIEPMTLYQYLQRHPSFIGIRIVRINK